MIRKVSRKICLVASILALGLGIAVVSVSPAEAAPIATVMAQTQRMSDATLKSTQAGWYNKGSNLQLSCYKHGQAVKGYFSKNLPNGGWDDLWYRVSDGYFVADVDIETHSNSPVTAPCIGNPAPSSQSKSLAWPLQSVSINRGFGVNGHNGIDLRAGMGTPVYAAADGVVRFEGWGQNNSWMGK
ncbi:hypothetical protein GORHZ_184_00010, partial [Gordonia rhizosphera NBRC 16068]